MTEAVKQPELDGNLSRALDPKTQKEITGQRKLSGIVKFNDGRYGVIRATFDIKDAKDITVYNHLEFEHEFAEENHMKFLTQIEHYRRFI